MTENVVYYVWLQQALGEGNNRLPSVLNYFGSAREVYEADVLERRLCGFLNRFEIQKMSETTLSSAEEIIDSCIRLGYDILTPDAPRYPVRLLNIPDYPAALYISGTLPDIDREVCVAMVGTRRASRYGHTAATSIARELTACGAIVVSGCARGIDTAAHQGAILAGGRTVAVLGCGINTRYNMENEGLRKVIQANGALVSEYPPGAPPLNYHFPIRNRIISGLSLGVIVIEAGEKSGSLITANIALNQGRDIFSLPGQVNSYLSKGTNRLIFDGAKPIGSARDVLEEYWTKFPDRISMNMLSDPGAGLFEKGVRPKWDKEYREQSPSSFPLPVRPSEDKPRDNSQSGRKKKDEPVKPPADVSPPAKSSDRLPLGLSEESRRVLPALGSTPKDFQTLLDELGMSASVLMQSITELELYGLVTSMPGKKYAKR